MLQQMTADMSRVSPDNLSPPPQHPPQGGPQSPLASTTPVPMEPVQPVPSVFASRTSAGTLRAAPTSVLEAGTLNDKQELDLLEAYFKLKSSSSGPVGVADDLEDTTAAPPGGRRAGVSGGEGPTMSSGDVQMERALLKETADIHQHAVFDAIVDDVNEQLYRAEVQVCTGYFTCVCLISLMPLHYPPRYLPLSCRPNCLPCRVLHDSISHLFPRPPFRPFPLSSVMSCLLAAGSDSVLSSGKPQAAPAHFHIDTIHGEERALAAASEIRCGPPRDLPGFAERTGGTAGRAGHEGGCCRDWCICLSCCGCGCECECGRGIQSRSAPGKSRALRGPPRQAGGGAGASTGVHDPRKLDEARGREAPGGDGAGGLGASCPRRRTRRRGPSNVLQ